MGNITSYAPLYTLNARGNTLIEGPVATVAVANETYNVSGGPTGIVYNLIGIGYTGTNLSAVATVAVPTGTWTGTTAYFPIITTLTPSVAVVRVNKVTDGTTAVVEAANGEVQVTLTVTGFTNSATLPP